MEGPLFYLPKNKLVIFINFCFPVATGTTVRYTEIKEGNECAENVEEVGKVRRFT